MAETTEEGREWVLGFIRGLRATGIVAVRCGDLTAALAGRVRADWAARHADPASERAWEGDEEFGAVVRMVWPDESADSRERWERLKRAIPNRIASLDRQDRVRERLAVVFTALVLKQASPKESFSATICLQMACVVWTVPVTADFK